MPYISIESGRLTAEQKKQLIERLTATASEILCRAKRFAYSHIPEQFFTVTIKELPDEKFFAMQSAKAMTVLAASQSTRLNATTNHESDITHISTFGCCGDSILA